MNGQEYLDLLKARYSVSSFSDVQLTDAELDVLLQAAQLSPTAKNSQPFRLCVVQSAEGLAKIDEATRCRYGAPTVIIGAYDADVSAKGLGYETGDFGDIDTSIVLTNIANAAAVIISRRKYRLFRDLRSGAYAVCVSPVSRVRIVIFFQRAAFAR